MNKRSAIVIGAGIAGLATARALAINGYSVKVLERSHKAVGASVRNFGMIWPIGQPAGNLYERAMRSRAVWKQVCDDAKIWYDEAGSLHVAHHATEWQVLQELYGIYSRERPWHILSAEEIGLQYNSVVTEGLRGGLFSTDELIVDPRQAIGMLPAYLHHKHGVEFNWGKCVSYVADQTAYVGVKEEYEADLVFICSGADLETLYPEAVLGLPLTKCKLQMMRLKPQSVKRMGPALCGGLSLVHYNSFKASPSLLQLKKMYASEMAEYLELGIHVMVSQNEEGHLTVGDSHEYGESHDPFDRGYINGLILDYLKKFAVSADWRPVETWNGVYVKKPMVNHTCLYRLSPAYIS